MGGEILGLIHGHYMALKQVPTAEERAAGVDHGAVNFVFVKGVSYSHRMTPADIDILWWQTEQIALDKGAAFLRIFDDLYEGTKPRSLLRRGFSALSARSFLRMGVASNERGRRFLTYVAENYEEENFVYNLGYE